MTSTDAPAQAPLPFAPADVLAVVPEAASELAAELAFKAAPETVSETAPETTPETQTDTQPETQPKTAPNATPTRLPAPQTTTAMPLHIYRRDISPTERTSLSVIAELIATGSTVLDLGTGSGALGLHLRDHRHCVVDGVTYNDAEAALARPHYRRIVVADLDAAAWVDGFAAGTYDVIVCADVLEHLKQPERVLRACRQLLSPNGRVVISVPNVGYCGLVAELLQGEFAYRPEGLLDRTHLRFFTRRSLTRFLGDEGWAVESLQPLVRELQASEFRVPFDSLPPAVGRYLLAVPDALTYQLVVSAAVIDLAPAAASADAVVPAVVPAGGPAAKPLHAQPPLAPALQPQALFSAELFLGHPGAYSQQRKLTTSGVIGQLRQTLHFAWGNDTPPWTAIKLDPADRPGFLHLHCITLRAADGALVWQWRGDADGYAQLAHAASHQLLLRAAWPDGAPVAALLYGDDPWLELPIPPVLLAAFAAGSAGSLDIELGWPMSADYLAFAGPAAGRLSLVESALQQRVAERDGQAERQRALIAQHTDLSATLAEHQRLLREQRDRSLAEKTSLNNEIRGLQHEHHRLRRDFDGMSAYLQRIEDSRLFRMTRPLSDAKGWLDRTVRGVAAQPLAAAAAVAVVARPAAPTSHPVDVIVPVYRGLADTQRCLRSVLAAPNLSPYRLIVINDASPEPQLTAWLREFTATDARVLLIENDSNLGFVATVNRGMALGAASDVLLLNSDTEVANDWLDRLRRAAYSDLRVGTVTPFSNNATIFSYPKTCSGNQLPHGHSTQSLDALFARTLPASVIDVPTGVGFCMYVRRDCLAQVGLFDVAQFGKGYGEENDFCQRALKAGWRNLHALDTFVMHSGGVSFGDSKSARELAAMDTLRRLHPDYEQQVHDFVAADPAERFRQRVDLARISAGALPVVLMVMHDREGGTLRHLHELAAWAADRATCLVLTPARGPAVRLQLLSALVGSAADSNEGFALTFRMPFEFAALVDCLRALRVGHLHYHHLLGQAAEVMALPAHLGVAYDYTVHDYYAFCPQISLTGRDNTYCGELGEDQCRKCLLQSPAPGGVSIAQWRETYGGFVAAARHVLVPSRDAAHRVLRYAPAADVRYAPHDGLAAAAAVAMPAPAMRVLAADAPLKIVVIGALGPIKGADLLEAVAALAAAQSAPLDLHLIGHAYRSLRTQPRTRLTVHGKYDEADLGRLLDWLQPDLVWFPAQWPETYSYTLNACLERGLAVVAPDLGAFAERLSGRTWSWLQPWNTTPADWLRFFVAVREQHFATGRGPAVTHRMQPISVAAVDDHRIKSWSYERDYLAGVAVPDRAATLSAEFLLAHRPQRSAGADALRHGVKRTVLRAALRLRAAPALRRVSQAVPLRWQTRFKSWLQT